MLTPNLFTLQVNGSSNPFPNSFPGSAAGSVIRFTTAGSYNVTEQEDPRVVSERSVDCEGSISAGQNKTCTITNTVRGNGNTVVPIFVTVNNIGGGTRNASDFTPRATGPSNPNPPLIL